MAVFVFCLIFCSCTFFLAALDVALTVTNREAVAKTAEPITSGIPFAEGLQTGTTTVKLMQGSTEIPCQFRTLAVWPDGSIRWLLLDFQLDLPATDTVSLTLRTGATPATVTGIIVNNQSSNLTVNTGTTSFTFNKSELVVAGKNFSVTAGGTTYLAVPGSGLWTVEESGPLKTIVRVEGNFYNGSTRLSNALVGFRARFFFFKNHSSIRAQFTLRNNNSFGWNYNPQGPAVTLSGATFGVPLLNQGGSYVFGQGVEKTFELDVPQSGSPVKRESRYTATGVLADGYTTPRPLAVATPAYYAATRAWGQVTLPKTGFETSLQADFDLYEKLQRSKVIQADVVSPSGTTGITVWGSLYQDINSWNNYGDLQWGGGCGVYSGNSYDWGYGMFLHFMRTGHMAFLDAARVFVKHEIDFDIYHTNANGTAYNYQKNWETRPSNDSPDNCFGPGRPSHTWVQGYALYWLLTGEPRGKDIYDELVEGMRQYVYESFNINGYIDTDEIRIAGWIVDNLVTQWRMNPNATFHTSDYGTKTIQQALKDVLKGVFDRETAAGGHGYVYANDDPNLSQPLMNCYFLEPAIKAYAEVFKGRDNTYATSLLGLIRRMTTWLMSITFGGDTNELGQYRARQLPYMVDRSLLVQTNGEPTYVFMTLNAAGFCYTETGEVSYRNYMRPAFQDYIRYFLISPGNLYIEDSSLRSPTSYNSNVYPDTEVKVHGWSNRFGQYYFAAENGGAVSSLTLTSPNGGQIWLLGSTHAITWTSSGTIANVKIEFSSNNGSSWSTVASSTTNTGNFNWLVPSATPSTFCLIRISSTTDTGITDSSDAVFTITNVISGITIQLNRAALLFSAVNGSTVTPAQQVFIGSSGTGTLSWSASSDRSWLSVTPISGTGNGSITVSVNPTGLSIGTYSGTITVSDDHAANSPQTIAVTVNNLSGSSSPFGIFETPTEGATVRSSIAVTGWVLDDVGVDAVYIKRAPVSGEENTPVYIGQAIFVEGMRPDVELTYPDYPKNYLAGWGYMLLTNFLPNGGNGSFTLYAVAVDEEGNEVILGTKTITVDNAHAVKPFGAIDTPTQGGLASGRAFLNWGWALTPLPNTIPSNGSTINVWVDGVNLGSPTYNLYREDISTLFPGYNNSGGAVGYFYLNTTGYTNGVHSIQWTVTDNAGNTDGIGSRYMTIFNSGSSRVASQAMDASSVLTNDVLESLTYRTGFNTHGEPLTLVADEKGVRKITLKELEHVEIFFPENSVEIQGYRLSPTGLKPLPVGSTVVNDKRTFYWSPGPGFLGRYRLVFVVKDRAGGSYKNIVEIHITASDSQDVFK